MRVPLLLCCVAACSPAARPGEPSPSLVQTDSIREAIVSPGVRHIFRWHASGPWAVHIVEIAPGACGVELRTAKAGGQVIGRQTTSEIAREVDAGLGRRVLAAVNGDFFSYDPPGRPEGPQVSAGIVVKSEGRQREAVDGSGPVPQPSFAVTVAGQPVIAAATFHGSIQLGGAVLPLAGVNSALPENGVAIYNQYWGGGSHDPAAQIAWLARRIKPAGADTALAVLVRRDTLAVGVLLDTATLRIAARGATAAQLRTASAGDTLRWVARFPPVDGPVRELIAGVPILLRDGVAVYREPFALPSTFVDGRHPRTAVGWTATGQLLLITVDGRQPGYSDGMTLQELADYLHALGAREALNLDGGGSTALVLRGQLANRTSDEAGERAVANALLVLGPGAGECEAGSRDDPRESAREQNRIPRAISW